MKSTVSVIAPTSIRLDFNFTSQFVGTTVLPVGGVTYILVTMPTPSPFYAQLLLVEYTVEVDGVINVTNINLNLITKNDSNCNTRLQVSGDGGTTWVDVTDDIPGDGSTEFVRQSSGQWLSNIKIGKNPTDGLGMFRVRLLMRAIDGLASTGRFRGDSSISIEYNKEVTGALLPTPEFVPTLGRGFVAGGRVQAAPAIYTGANERFDDVANAWTARTAITARRDEGTYSFFMTDFGFTSGGFDGSILGTTERFDDIANTQTARTSITARTGLTGFSISLPAKPLPNMYGYTSCGDAGAGDLGTTQRYDNDANSQTARTAATARTFPAGYSMFGAGFTSAGQIAGVITGTTQRLNDVANTWTSRTSTTARFGPTSYSIRQFGLRGDTFHPLGYTSGGATAIIALGTTERFDDFANTQTSRTLIDPHYRLAGFSMLGYGYTSCGYDVNDQNSAETQRYDDITDTQTTRQNAITARTAPAGYSLEENFIQYPQAVGNGFTSCGTIGFSTTILSGITERFDDTTNAQVSRSPATPRRNPAGFSMLGFGYTSCGLTTDSTGLTERFDDTVDNHTTRTSATARRRLAGYSFNNFGFTSCGFTSAPVGTTEKLDDTANTWTTRTNATARYNLAGFNIGNFGFTACGFISGAASSGLVEKFDDTANTQTARASATPRSLLAAYSMLGFGYTSCGLDDSNGFALGTTERFNDTANTWTARTDAFTRTSLGGYSFNNFGFTSCGFFVGVRQRITQKFDDGANTHTLRANAFPRESLTGYNI